VPRKRQRSLLQVPYLKILIYQRKEGFGLNLLRGPSFSIDEFETVGNAVKAFASENANSGHSVTVIDMDMTDELACHRGGYRIGTERKTRYLISLESSASRDERSTMSLDYQANGSAPILPVSPVKVYVLLRKKIKHESSSD